MKLSVSVKATDLQKDLRGYPQRLQARLIQVMTRLSIIVQRHVKENKLSGQVLHVRTGTLRRSINREVVVRSDEVRAIIGTNVSYARAHEYGYNGPQTVKAHLRTIKQVFGKPLAAPKEVSVRGFTRTVNIPERSFLRSAIRDLEPRILQDIKDAAASVVK